MSGQTSGHSHTRQPCSAWRYLQYGSHTGVTHWTGGGGGSCCLGWTGSVRFAVAVWLTCLSCLRASLRPALWSSRLALLDVVVSLLSLLLDSSLSSELSFRVRVFLLVTALPAFVRLPFFLGPGSGVQTQRGHP